jgi:ketopantoate reductase
MKSLFVSHFLIRQSSAAWYVHLQFTMRRAQEHVTDGKQIWVGARQESPGVIRHTASEHTDIGLYPNPEVDAALENERLEGFAAMLRAAKTSYAISDNIQVKRWEKVVWNVSLSGYPEWQA